MSKRRRECTDSFSSYPFTSLFHFAFITIKQLLNNSFRVTAVLKVALSIMYTISLLLWFQKETSTWTYTSIFPSGKWEKYGQYLYNSWWSLQRRTWWRWLLVHGLCISGDIWLDCILKKKIVNNLVFVL